MSSAHTTNCGNYDTFGCGGSSGLFRAKSEAKLQPTPGPTLSEIDESWVNTVVSCTQALLVAASLHMLQMATRATVGRTAGAAFAALCISQFHLVFYASRPLPNTFALVLCCAASSYWLRSKHPRRTLLLLTVAAVRL